MLRFLLEYTCRAVDTSVRLMRATLIWLLVLGVCAGSQLRIIGVDPCEILAAMHLHEHGHHNHENGDTHHLPCDSSHDKQCPLEHHHHANCTHCMPMAAELVYPARVCCIHYLLMPIRVDGVRAPDAPCADLDKPPLI